MTKKQLRHIYKQYRSFLSPNEKLALEAKVYDQLRQNVQLEGYTIHTFLPISRLMEIDTYPLLQEQNVNWVISKSDFNSHKMTNYFYDPSIEIKKSDWDIPEPVGGSEVSSLEIDIVLTPLLCFDLRGVRVGYGKGFYDRFLATCRPDVIKIGITLFEPTERIEDASDHDIRLSLGITPDNIYYF